MLPQVRYGYEVQMNM